MAIDAKEWAGKLNAMGMLPEVVSYTRLTQWVIDLIEAKVADMQTKIVGDGDPQPPQPEAGDVPEYIERIVGRVALLPISTAGANALDDVVREEVEAEIARRVANAERRLIVERDTAIRNYETEQQAVAAKDAEIAELRAECERLRTRLKPSGGCRILSIGDACDCTLCKQDREIDKLRQQLADAQRPVEATVSWTDNTGRRCVCESDFRRERAARVAATADVRELREFVRHYFIVRYSNNECVTESWSCPITDADLDRLLADFRAAKGGGA